MTPLAVVDQRIEKCRLEVARAAAAERGEITPSLPVIAFWPGRE